MDSGEDEEEFVKFVEGYFEFVAQINHQSRLSDHVLEKNEICVSEGELDLRTEDGRPPGLTYYLACPYDLPRFLIKP